MNSTKIIARWESFSPRLLSVLRIVAAIMFMLIGTMKLFAFPAGIFPNGGTVQLMSEMGLAGILEAFGGALFCSGSLLAPLPFFFRARWLLHISRATFPTDYWPITERRSTRRALLFHLALFLRRWRRPMEPRRNARQAIKANCMKGT